MPSGVPKNVPPSGTPAGRAAFALSMRRLAEVEALPVYAEMRRAADARVLGAGGVVAAHGWDSSGSMHDPRKERKAAPA